MAGMSRFGRSAQFAEKWKAGNRKPKLFRQPSHSHSAEAKGFHSGKHLTQSGPFLTWNAVCNNPRCGSAPRGSVRSASSVLSDCKLTPCGPSGILFGQYSKKTLAQK